MNISSTSINRPVLATVISLLILLFGIIGFTYLGVREYPNVDPPVINVSTSLMGANAEVVESQVTEPLEASINGIAGISSISSTSSDGRSNISVEFELGTDLEAAANDVRDRVSRMLNRIPPNADPPVVSKADANAMPILSLTIQSDRRDLLELSDIAINTFKERLQTIPGVGEVNIWGEKRYAMKLMLDPQKMAALNISPQDVRQAVTRENVELPAGRIEGYRTEMAIRTMGRINTPEEFNNLIIRENNGAVIRLSDIGQAVLGPENERTLLRGNGKIPMVAVALSPQPGTNYIDIADEFYRRVEQLKNEIPSDLQLGIAFDTTRSIRKAITEVEETIFIAFGLVVLIIFLFLRNWRTTLIPIVSIPVSLIGSFFVMYVAGFSINVLTLLAIVLATGLVVDDAIVVMENIYHKIENGMDPIKAGHKGSHEIVFAIISTTITLASVFLPIVFMQGLTGRLFREFGIVMAGSVLISAFVSLTLTPMMSARFIRKSKRDNWLHRKTEKWFDALNEGYNRSLTSFMNRRWVSLIIMAVCIATFIIIWRILPAELAPMEDKSRISVSSTAPEGVSFEMMNNYMDRILDVVDTLPEKEALTVLTAPGFSSGSTNTGMARVMLKDPSERTLSQQELADKLSGIFSTFTFARTFVTQEQTIGGMRSSGLPVQYVIQAPNFQELKSILPVFLANAQATQAFQTIDVNLKFNKPELVIEIDRDKAKALGVSVNDISESLQLLYSGQRYGFFIRNNKQYQIIGQARREDRNQPVDLTSVYLRNNRNELVQLNNLIKTSERSNPPQLYRYNRYVSATVSAATVKGLTLGQGLEVMAQVSDSTLPENFSTALTGASKDFAQSSGSLAFAFILALVLIYLILAAQFESFRDPLTIMFTVPLALAGALASLLIFGQTLNIFSQIGMIMLIGIVTKNGILIVEFANQRRRAGLEIREAVIDAATRRLRPILMTSLATILGAMPIALSIGASGKSRVPMGITIIGGLLFGLVLTLYVIPTLYTYLTRKKIEKLPQ
jgi:multidrug efflux pump